MNELLPITPTLAQRGWGAAVVAAPDGSRVENACAASSVVQLLCAQYGQPFTYALAARVATVTHTWSGTPTGSPLEIANAWWIALTELFPNGPWPGLLVLYGRNRIEWERSILLRIPGPVDERVFAVIGDGAHFDPIWWQGSDGYKATCAEIPAPISNIATTLTAGFGPARGSLRLLGSTYIGSLPFQPSGSGPCSQEDTDDTLNGQGNWEAWAQYIVREGLLNEITKEDTTIVLLGCHQPTPPYPEIWSIAQGLKMLTPRVRIAHDIDHDNASNLVIIAFDTDGGHIGTAHPVGVRNALTQLCNLETSLATAGRRES